MIREKIYKILKRNRNISFNELIRKIWKEDGDIKATAIIREVYRYRKADDIIDDYIKEKIERNIDKKEKVEQKEKAVEQKEKAVEQKEKLIIPECVCENHRRIIRDLEFYDKEINYVNLRRYGITLDVAREIQKANPKIKILMFND